MFNFVKIYREGEEWGWYVKISSVLELYDWYYAFNGPAQIGSAVTDFMNSKEFNYMKVRPEGGPLKNHYSTQYGNILRVRAERLAESKGSASLLDLIDTLTDSVFKVKEKFINEGHTLYINKAGGFMPSLGPEYEVKETIISEELIFPEYTEKDIKIIRWPNGVHYYAKIGCVDVVIDGEMKWKTEERAYEKALVFLKVMKRKKKL
jgi:hypothetical protein